MKGAPAWNGPAGARPERPGARPVTGGRGRFREGAAGRSGDRRIVRPFRSRETPGGRPPGVVAQVSPGRQRVAPNAPLISKFPICAWSSAGAAEPAFALAAGLTALKPPAMPVGMEPLAGPK